MSPLSKAAGLRRAALAIALLPIPIAARVSPDIAIEVTARDIALGLDPVLHEAQLLSAKFDLYANFAGNWTGQLEYRDYTNNKRVVLPTWLKITEAPDHRSMTYSFVYDDGPTKTVREHVTLTLDPDTRKATLMNHDETSEEKTTIATYDVAGLEEFAKTGGGVLKMTGRSTDNGKPVEVRLTITLLRNLYTERKEIRPLGSVDENDFQFRDGYTFTRADAPAAP